MTLEGRNSSSVFGSGRMSKNAFSLSLQLILELKDFLIQLFTNFSQPIIENIQLTTLL